MTLKLVTRAEKLCLSGLNFSSDDVQMVQRRYPRDLISREERYLSSTSVPASLRKCHYGILRPRPTQPTLPTRDTLALTQPPVRLYEPQPLSRQPLTRIMHKSKRFIVVADLEHYQVIRTVMNNRQNSGKLNLVSFFNRCKATGAIILEPIFSWPCCDPIQHFDAVISCKGNYIVITGIDVFEGFSKYPQLLSSLHPIMPNIKTIAQKDWTSKDLSFTRANRKYWPHSVTFDPRSSFEDEMCCILNADERRLFTREAVHGRLARCSASCTQDNQDTAGAGAGAGADTFCIIAEYEEHQVDSSHIAFLCDGEQIITTEVPVLYAPYAKVILLNSRNLMLLHRLPILPTCRIKDMQPLYSVCETKVALFLWKRTGVPEVCVSRDMFARRTTRTSTSQVVAVYEVSRLLLRTLEVQSAMTILTHVQQENLHDLPLPRTLIQKLINRCRY